MDLQKWRAVVVKMGDGYCFMTFQPSVGEVSYDSVQNEFGLQDESSLGTNPRDIIALLKTRAVSEAQRLGLKAVMNLPLFQSLEPRATANPNPEASSESERSSS